MFGAQKNPLICESNGSSDFQKPMPITQASFANPFIDEEKASVDKKSWHDKLEQKTLGLVAKKWDDQLMINKNEFDNVVHTLSKYELNIQSKCQTIDCMQQNSEILFAEYKNGIDELDSVQADQEIQIKEIIEIEKELDLLLPQYLEYEPLYKEFFHKNEPNKRVWEIAIELD